jgi:hypothetical protein
MRRVLFSFAITYVSIAIAQPNPGAKLAIERGSNSPKLRIVAGNINKECLMRTKSRTISLAVIAYSLISGAVALAQSGHAKQASCVILKRMGPADEVTSHLYSFGIRGKQFQFIEGKLPEGSSFHGRLTDHDVRNLQERGAEVLILEAHYTAQDLTAEREQCKAMTGADPNQVPVAKSETAGSSAATQAAPAAPMEVSISVDSTPQGADIEVDGVFVGNTPSTVSLAPGGHKVSVSKKGFADWTRKMNITSGTVHVNAELEEKPGQ